MLPSLVNKELVDRLPFIATHSYSETEHLLGKERSLQYQVLEDWGLTDRVQVICCDTTASNTGRENGAGILLAQQHVEDIYLLPLMTTYNNHYH
ncbi:hypothetical protein J437_LFUL010321, partial [Ladona fulva]